MGDIEAGFEALGGAEIGQEAALQGDFLELVNDGLGFFGGHLEMAVFLEFAFGGFPPFFPVVGDDIGDQDLLDLVHGGAVAEALEDELDQIHMIQGGHFAEDAHIGNLAGVDMVLGNGLEGFGGEGHVHGVAGLGLEINGEAGENQVGRGDFAETPTAMVTKSALGEKEQGFDLLAAELSGGDEFFKFFFHCNFQQSINLLALLRI